jgi:hypothetical protein
MIFNLGNKTISLRLRQNYKNIKYKDMAKTITFDELRKIKDQLPSGSMRKIAEKLDLNEETVRNYFGGRNFEKGESMGVHFEQGPGGGIVSIDDTTILDMAQEMIKA